MIMHPAIKLRHIRLFLAIAAKGNLSAVARAEGVTQPAVSRALAELETLLGKPLFRREGRGLVLTEAGALFRRHASQGVQSLDAGAAAVRPESVDAVVRIGILPTVATRFFPKVALRFHGLEPETTLSVVTGPHAYLIGLLRSGAIDLMVGRMPAAAEMADLAFDHLYEEEVVVAVRAGHPLSHQHVAEILPKVPLILPPQGAIIRRVVDEYIASVGLAGIRPAFETVALALGRGIVLGSDALWFISRGVIFDSLERGELLALPTHAAFLSGAVGITRRQSQMPRPSLETLVEIARGEAGIRP